jgi:YD repeat-containing protein
MKRILIASIGVMCMLTTFGQLETQNQKNISNITPPSPEAASLGKYVEIPVGYYTGTPEISLPLANIKQGGLSVPVSISYHASGIRVEEFANWTGAGWTLNAGGAVTRVIKGLPDDKSDQQSFQNLAAQYTYEYLIGGPVQGSDPRGVVLRDIYKGCADAEPDLFLFNFNGYSGKMMFNWNGQLVVSCTKPVKVADVRGTDGYANRIIGWNITTEDGTLYKFRDVEKSLARFNNSIGGDCRNAVGANSSWFITEIADVNNENKIFFEYDDYTQTFLQRTSTTIKHDHMNAAGTVMGNASVNTYYGKRVKKITTSSGNTTVEFVPGALRTDIGDLFHPNEISENNNIRSLNRVVVKDNTGVERSGFNLVYDYSSNRLTLKSLTESYNGQSKPAHEFSYEPGILPSINATSQDHWGFYNGASNAYLLPGTWLGGQYYYEGADRSVNTEATKSGTLNKIKYPTGGQVQFEYEQNEYGYVQGTNIDALCRFNTTPQFQEVGSGGNNAGSPVGLQSVNFTVAPYPCGQADIDHETMKFHYEGFNYDMPTLGSKPYIKLLKADGTELFFHRFAPNESNPAVESLTFYKRLVPGNYILQAFGKYNTTNPPGYPPNYAKINVSYRTPTTQKYKELAGGLRVKKISEYESVNDPKPRIRNYNYSPNGDNTKSTGVIYQEQRYEYGGTEIDYYTGVPTGLCLNNTNEYSYIMRMSQNITSLGTTQGSHIGYREVTVTFGNNPYNGKSTYKFTSPVEYSDDIAQQLPFQSASSQSYMTGLLKEQYDYAYDGTATKPVSSVINEYINKETQINGLKIGSKAKMDCAIGSCCMEYFIYGQYANFLGHTQLKKTTSRQYSTTGDGTYAENVQEFFYDNEVQNLKKQIKHESGGTKQVSEMYYIRDYPQQTEPFLQLRHYNITGIPLETVVKKMDASAQETIIGGTWNKFSAYTYPGKIKLVEKWNMKATSPVLPGQFSVSTATGNPDSRYTKDAAIKYDVVSGNIIQEKTRDLASKSYIWDHNNNYPVAFVVNALADDIAFCSFEAEGKGNWNFTGTPVANPAAPAGKKIYNLITGSVTKNFNTIGIYIVSFWKQGDVQLNGAVLYRTGRTINNWTYVEYMANESTGVTISGTGSVDELRLFPKNAQMISYTYQPLVGLTTQSDANGNLLYYEYDALGRLKFIRDMDKNVVKAMEYKYGAGVGE